MKKNKVILWGVIGLGLLLSACVWPESNDPFEKLPEEELIKISGFILPFSASVSTRATHRAEEDGKLVAYLASDVVRLSDFEGEEVTIEGVWRHEKMREIFQVQSLRLIAKTDAEEITPNERFITRRFTFLYPISWSYTLSPDGTAYFLDKNDPARRVFLTVSVRDLTAKDAQQDPNVLIANLAGIKKISSDDIGRDRHEITLFSNLYKQKYTFIFTHNFEDFERKKAFFVLLNSFIEGEDNVLAAKQNDLITKAEKEAAKIQHKEKEIVVTEPEPKTETESSVLNDWVEKAKNILNAPAEKNIVTTTTNDGEVNFVNLLDQKAFSYESAYYDLSLRVPFGFWFQNFGPRENLVTQLGFADHPINSRDEVEFWLDIINTEQPISTINETTIDDQITIEAPRNDHSYLKFHGPARFRDAMLSIHSSLGGK